jgi:hypothetical protein
MNFSLAQLTSMHSRWKVFRGDNTDSDYLLFSAKRSSMFQFNTTLDVFLAKNTKDDVCDFKVKGSFNWQQSCVIYAGNSSTVLAQVRLTLIYTLTISQPFRQIHIYIYIFK